ncbi:uncharacterized protein TrAtP1_000985 [Trichoderma atroviride]|uniref:uncharacterized protein n=1 Tax=Hypocrea atroviridis TaxID=63577 RepID=UPI003329C4F0|nr:hypothetical protein TrAtP1_000985 [Trichoderma atroviride]
MRNANTTKGNRDDPTGYRIVSIAFDSNGQPTAPQNSTNAVTDIITNANLTNCPDKCFRPVGLAWDSAGRLWFSSDTTGEVFVLERTNSSSNGTTSGGSGGSSGEGGNDNAGNSLILEKPGVVAVAQAAAVAGLLLV